MIHHGLIADFITESNSAHAKGSAYRLEVGYPVYLNQGQQNIPGCLVTLNNSTTLLQILDQFHGYSSMNPEKSLYLRVEVEVFINEGIQQAFAYVMNPKKLPKSALLIEDGNWEENLKITPPKSIELSEREKTYIRKLSRSSGRDIVPIQLDLYRNLLNQGIIVDKGRRLALTKFGLELSRYLD